MNTRKWLAWLTALTLLLAQAAAGAEKSAGANPFGVLSGISWSLSEDGELILRGRGAIPSAALYREEEASGGLDIWYEMPWHVFRDSVRRVILSDGITAVGDHAFDGCVNLESAVLPEGLEEIGEAAFRGTGLRSLVLPDSVTRIGAHAFSGCWRLETADLGGSLREIGPYAFYLDRALVSVALPGTLIRSGYVLQSEVLRQTPYGGRVLLEELDVAAAESEESDLLGARGGIGVGHIHGGVGFKGFAEVAAGCAAKFF